MVTLGMMFLIKIPLALRPGKPHAVFMANNTNPATKTMSKADHLRAALKAAGYNARRVTVKYDYSTLRVTLRDATIAKSVIEKIANQFERIDRDTMTGEILCGGNTFVDVAYADGLLDASILAIAEQLAAAEPNRTVTIAGRQVSKMAPSAGRWDWTVVSFDDIEPRIHAHANGPDAAGMMFPAGQLAECAIELAAAPAVVVEAPAHDVEQMIPVLSPSACVPLAPFPRMLTQAELSAAQGFAAEPATVTPSGHRISVNAGAATLRIVRDAVEHDWSVGI